MKTVTSPSAVRNCVSVHPVPADLRLGHSSGGAGQLEVVALLHDDRGVAARVGDAGYPKEKSSEKIKSC